MYHKFLLLTMDQMMVHMEARLLHSQNRRGENILGTLRTCILVKIEWRGKRRFSKKKKKNISIDGVDQRSTLVPEST